MFSMARSERCAEDGRSREWVARLFATAHAPGAHRLGRYDCATNYETDRLYSEHLIKGSIGQLTSRCRGA